MTTQLKDQSAPDFTLPAVAGNLVSLADYRGTQNVVLVFNRGLL